MSRLTAITLTLCLVTVALMPAASAQTNEEDDVESFLNNLQATGIYQPNNPWLNPGFEVTTGTEVSIGNQTHVVAPPTYFRSTLDDGNDATPYSTQEVVLGGGTSGNALLINWNASDTPRKVSLGQALAVPGQPFGFQGATGVSFDFKSEVNTSFAFTLYHTPNLSSDLAEHYVRAFSDVVPASEEWNRVTLTFDTPAPADEFLTHAILRIMANENGNMTFDNVVIEGSDYEPLTQESDLTDSYAVIIDADTEVRFFETGLGERYLFPVKIRDYTAVTPGWAQVTSSTPQLFSILNLSYVQSGFNMSSVPLFEPVALSSDGETALYAFEPDVALNLSESGVAGLWAYAGLGDSYEIVAGEMGQAAAGYFSVKKNMLNHNAIADVLDYAFTPVQLLNESAGLVTKETSVAVLDSTGGTGFEVRVQHEPTGFVETTTVNVAFPDGTVASQPVTLDGEGTEAFVQFTGDPTGVVATLEPTVLLAGSTHTAIDPVANFTSCALRSDGCAAMPLSFEDITFDGSTSVDFNGDAPVSYEWAFDQRGEVTGASGVQVTHAFTKPTVVNETFTVKLTVTDAQGRTNTAIQPIEIANREPVLKIVDTPNADRVNGAIIDLDVYDVDGTITEVVVKLFNETGAGVDAKVFYEAVDFVTFNMSGQPLGTYEVLAYAYDDFGKSTNFPRANFDLVNLAPTVTLVADKVLVNGTEAVTFTLSAEDPDNTTAPTLSLDFGDGNTVASPSANETHVFGATGIYAVTLNATDAEGGVSTAIVPVGVDADAAITTPVFDRESTTSWFDGPVSVSFEVDSTGPAPAAVTYGVDANATEAYSEAFEVAGEGEHTVKFFSTDAVGNVETEKSVAVNIDETAPEVDASQLPADQIVSGEVELTGTASDALSGVGETRLYIDGVLVASAAGDAVTYTWDTTSEFFASHEVTLEGVDLAGNTVSETVTVYVFNVPDRVTAEVSGSASNDGDNPAGFPAQGSDSAGVAVFLDGFAVQVELPDREQTTNTTLAFAGLLADSAVNGEGGSAGLQGSVFALGTTCHFYTWGGENVNPAYEPRVNCGLV